MMKLKTNKTYTKGSRQKKIETEVEISIIKRIKL